MSTDPTPSPNETLDRVQELLDRAQAGEDVSETLSLLPEAIRVQVQTVLTGRKHMLGLPSPIRMPSTLPAGAPELLAGRYQVQAELGRGGMGVVYRAEDLQRGKPVVVKVMALDKAFNPRLRARFDREARALKKIHRHPNVVHVVDAGEDPTQGPYLVMELVEGHELQAGIRSRGRIDPRRATEIARDVARGLAVVHRAGLIHRDVKPANIMILPNGRAKLVDFGLAKDTFLTTITKTGQILGTCYYMAPEQWEEDVKEDARCDVFALGATLYHMLVGTPPFTGEDLGEIMEECLSGEYEPAEEEVEGLFGDLPLVLHQLLATDRRFRYARMDDVAEDLARVLRGEPCRVPCLVDAKGERHALYPGRRWTLGRDASCHVTVADPTVSRSHAEVRREERGYVLRDLDSSYGTAVGEHKISAPHVLQGGDLVDLGDVRLTFQDPHNRPQGSAFGQDLRRRAIPDPALRVLVDLGDPRVLAALLQELQPSRARAAVLHRAIAQLLGPEAAEAVALAGERRAARVEADLAAISAQIDPGGVAGWLAWWDHTRFEAIDQLGPAEPPPTLRLRTAGGAEHVFGSEGVLLIGRDARCHLVLESQRVSRLHTSLFRLHRRWFLRDEGSAAGTQLSGDGVSFAFVDPGARLTLGDMELLLEEAPQPVLTPVGSGLHAVDPVAFDGLLDRAHPATAAALVGFLSEDPAWIDNLAPELFPDPPRQQGFVQRVRALYAERVAQAQELLPTLLGGSPGADPAAWQALLQARASALPPQVVPIGWLAVTRN